MPVKDELPTTESVRERSTVEGTTAVVTGASSGIGRAIAETFVADGAAVVICSRTQADVEAVAEELNVADLPGEVLAVECDVTDRESVARDVGTPHEVADTVRFLASGAVSFITGQTIAPTGPPHTFSPPEV